MSIFLCETFDTHAVSNGESVSGDVLMDVDEDCCSICMYLRMLQMLPTLG